MQKEVMNVSSQIISSEKIPQIRSSSSSELGSYQNVGKETMVGFEDEARKLVEQLMGEKQQLESISIVGMAGLGKTTLARKVYNDPSIVYHFYIRAWTAVTQVPRKRDIFLGILRSGFDCKDENNNLSDEDLTYMLKRRLSGQRYLIVLDDIWDIGAWNDLKWSFPDNRTGSRIIFTSRLAEMPLRASYVSHQLHLRFLTNDESWYLFQAKIFKKKSCPPQLVEIGKHITRKCRGLPLAIVVMAGLLANDMSPNWWSQIAEDMRFYTADDSKHQINTLALSYNHLPHHLKPCFLYFGAFPEDYEIPAWRLILLWLGEGFILHQIGGNNLEDIAAVYLNDLINRSLVIVATRRSDGGVKTCLVHDLLRDLCLRKAHEENFLQLLERYKPYNSVNRLGTPLRTVPHRLCIHSKTSFETIKWHSSQNFQSLLCCTSLYQSFLPSERSLQKFQSCILQNSKLLRVLDLSSLGIPNIPIEIVELTNLRYLALQPDIDSIPPRICNLENLETLILLVDGGVTVPKCIWKMVKLRHLIIPGRNVFEKPCFEIVESSDADPLLENLQTISTLTPDDSSEEILKRTPNLRKLHFCGDMYRASQNLVVPNLDTLDSLENLKLLCRTKFRPEPAGTLSSPDIFPVSLKKLTLSGTFLHWDEMQKIGMLPNLEVLKLRSAACHGERWETNEGGFPRLKYLAFAFLKIVEWSASSEHFPNLQHLRLDYCKQLEEIPFGLGDIYTLEMIEVKECNSAVAWSAHEIIEGQKNKGNDLLKISITDYGFDTSYSYLFLVDYSSLTDEISTVIPEDTSVSKHVMTFFLCFSFCLLNSMLIRYVF